MNRQLLAAVVVVLSLAAGLAAAAESGLSAKPQGRIVFSSDRSGPWRIWIIGPDGKGLRELTKAGPDEHDVDPCFSPDGKLLLFASTRGKTTGVWKMGADGEQPTRICDGDQAEWSPDGKSILLRRSQSGLDG
jgi:Tol biopolymer transport system component